MNINMSVYQKSRIEYLYNATDIRFIHLKQRQFFVSLGAEQGVSEGCITNSIKANFGKGLFWGVYHNLKVYYKDRKS